MRQADVNLAAVRRNLDRIRERSGADQLVFVVKANGYGHGAVEVAKAALESGVDLLGVADITEALELRDAGVHAPTLAWLHGEGSDFAAAIAAEVDLAVSDAEQLERVIRAAESAATTARVHLEFDSGLGRGGVRAADWGSVCERAEAAEAAGAIVVVGLMSHLANAGSAASQLQAERFAAAAQAANAAGLQPRLQLLEASEAALTSSTHTGTGVRVGIAGYGLTPIDWSRPASEWGLEPVLRLRSEVAMVSEIAAGEGVSYGLDWRAPQDSRVALVPLGYADGLPRAASGRAQVSIRGRRFDVVGRIAMDQVVVHVGDAGVAVGDPVVFWGDPAAGEPSVDEWASWAGTIGYELVTKIGRRVRYHWHED